jgi:hypothetical protein
MIAVGWPASIQPDVREVAGFEWAKELMMLVLEWRMKRVGRRWRNHHLALPGACCESIQG